MNMKLKITILAALILLSSSFAIADDYSKDELEIIELNRWVPLVLKEAGFEAYTELFHPDYTNWYMQGEEGILTTREQFLGGVRGWFEDGNYANFSEVQPISIDILGDVAYFRHIQEEHFVHPDGSQSMFKGYFASIMKKHEGKWTFYRTSFSELYRGEYPRKP